MAKKLKVMQLGDMTITPLKGGRFEYSIGGKKTVSTYKELWAVLFVLGDKKYQDEMMPVRKKEMMIFSRKHQIRVSRDVKAGEEIVVWCEVNIPKIVVESLVEKEGGKILYQNEEVVPTDTLDGAKGGVQLGD